MSKKFIYSVADTKGNVVIPFDAGYDSIEPFGDWLKVGKGKCFGLVNEKGETVLPCEYEKFSHIHAGIYYFSKNNKTGILDKNKGKIVAQCEYDKVQPIWDYSEGYTHFIVEKDNKLGLIDIDGNVIVPCECSEIYQYDGSGVFVFTKEDGTMGAYFARLKESIPFGKYFISCDPLRQAPDSDEVLLTLLEHHGEDTMYRYYYIAGLGGRDANGKEMLKNGFNLSDEKDRDLEDKYREELIKYARNVKQYKHNKKFSFDDDGGMGV